VSKKLEIVGPTTLIGDYLRQKYPDLGGIVQNDHDNTVTIHFTDGCQMQVGGLSRSISPMENLESFLESHRKNCKKDDQTH